MKFTTLFISLLFLATVAIYAAMGGNSMAAAKDYTYAQKNDYVKKMQNEIAKINKEIYELEAKAKKANAKYRAEANLKIKALKKKASQLNMHMEKVKTATETNWDRVKADFHKAISEFEDSVRQVRSWLSKKIAP
jgi:peptidoglycan hydrolase CwlO-like protein